MVEAKLYESPALRNITGPAIRPGGFQLTDRGVACCGLAPGRRVLDIGCGTGAVVDYLGRRYGFSAMGLDLSTVLLQEGLKTFGTMQLVRGRAEQIPAADARFAAVLCECMLSLCPGPTAVLEETLRVLQPGGYLILTDVYARGAVDVDSPLNVCRPVSCCLQGAVGRSAVEDRIKAAGYDLLLWEDHSMLLNQLAAKLVWIYGSLDAFWEAVVGPEAAEVMAGSGAGGCRRPGYYLAVAQKTQAG